MHKPSAGGLVYSTESGRMCSGCCQPVAACVCATLAARPRAGGGFVRVGRETQGRGGKVVTVVRGIPADAAVLGALGKRLRAACGSGGTVKDSVLEVQGDHRERVIELLTREGYTVKRSGG